jgi:hypothetical protein
MQAIQLSDGQQGFAIVQGGGWIRFLVPLLTAAIVLALGMLLVSLTSSSEAPDALPHGSPPAIASPR